MIHSVDSPEVKDRLLRKLQRALQRDVSAREAAEAAALSDEAELQRLVVETSHRVHSLSGSADLRGTLEYAASVHTQAAAVRALGVAQAALDPGTPAAEAAAALAATAAAPAAATGLEEEEAREAARAARLQRLLRSARPPPAAQQPWSNQAPDPVALGTARVAVGTGSADLSLLPVTHGEKERNAVGPWVPSSRSKERTLPPPGKAPGTASGTWAGHHALDAPALGASRGLLATGRPLPSATSGSLARFPHDPIPPHTLPPSAFVPGGSTQLPRALLCALTRQQLMAPRHPAYMLDSHLHHGAAWRQPRRTPAAAFSVPPASAPPTINDRKRAAVAMVPDRSLPASDPVHAGKPAYLPSAAHPAPLFSKVPLDYEWLQAVEKEQRESREGVFWQAAAVMAGEGAAAAAQQQQQQQQQQQPLLPMRHGHSATGEATFRTFSASGMHEQSARRGLDSFRATARAIGGMGGALAEGGAAAEAPALSLVTGPLGKFQALRTALVFGSAGEVREYEAARRALGARKAMGARALEAAKAEVMGQLQLQESRLLARGVGTGAASTRAAKTAQLLKQALEL